MINRAFYSISLCSPERYLLNVAAIPGTQIEINMNTKLSTTVSKHLRKRAA